MSTVVRRPISKSTRFQVFTRDRFTCQYCSRAAPEVVLHVDHYIPVSAGGPDDFWNLLTACQDCNAGKSARFSRRIMISEDWDYQIVKITPKFKDAVITIKVSMREDFRPEKCETLEEYFSTSEIYAVEESFRKTKGRILHPDCVYLFDWPLSQMIENRWNTPAKFLTGVFYLVNSRIDRRRNEEPFVPCHENIGEVVLDMLQFEPVGTPFWSNSNTGGF